jgi:intracellular sulfur oxidation DsrE/DsrF family protein
MNTTDLTYRRGFLGRVFGAVAAAGLAGVGAAEAQSKTAATQTKAPAPAAAGPDAWISEVKGTHRCLFDFPQHKNGVPLLHILNYLNTYKEAYKAAPGSVGAVGTFYALGTQSSIPLGFNDAMWAKYQLGDYMGLKDASGKAYTRNVFHRPTANDAHLLMQAFQTPNIPELVGAVPAMGIESLQKMGTKFIMCNNALGGWVLELQARGKGKADAIQKDLTENLLAGVTIVPAMVIAIEKAQAAGIRYNRQ